MAPSGNKRPPLIPSGRRFFAKEGQWSLPQKHNARRGLVKLIGALATEHANGAAGQTSIKRLNFVPEWLNEDYLLGADFCVADAYLFVMPHI